MEPCLFGLGITYFGLFRKYNSADMTLFYKIFCNWRCVNSFQFPSRSAISHSQGIETPVKM